MLHILGALPIGLAIAAAYRQQRYYLFVFLGLAAYHVLGLLSLPSLTTEFDTQVLLRNEMITLSGAVLLFISVSAIERCFPKQQVASENPIRSAGDQWAVYAACVATCLALISVIIARRGASLFEGTWEEFRQESSRLDAVATLLQYLVIPSAWVAYRAGRRLSSGILLVFGLFIFGVLGSRAALLTLPAIIAIDVLRSATHRRINRFAVVTLIAAALLLHTGGRIVRGVGIGGVYRILSGASLTSSEIGDLFQGIDWTGGESEVIRYFSVVSRDSPVPEIPPLVSVTRWITIYLPRELSGGLKPEDSSYVLWRHSANVGVFEEYQSWPDMLTLLQAGETGSVHPTLWGEAWLNGGLPAMLVFCLLLGLILVGVDRVLALLPPVVAALAAPAVVSGYLMVARGNSVIGLGYVAYLIPVALALVLAVSRLHVIFASGVGRRL